MKLFLIGFLIGIFGGGALGYLYASYVIRAYQKAANAVGIAITKIEGEYKAVKRAL